MCELFSNMSLATVKDNRIQSYQQNSVYPQSPGCNPFTFYHAFANEFEQYYMAFSGFIFPVQGVRFTFYEDFVERQIHNVAVTKPLQRHVLTRASFLGFLHQLFETVKDKVDANWKPTAVLSTGLNWTEGCPEHLQSLREVPYCLYNSRIIAEPNSGLQTNMELMDNDDTNPNAERVSENNSSLALVIKRVERLRNTGQQFEQEQKENSFAHLSNIKVSDENSSLFHVFEEQFEQYYVAFTGCIFPVHGVCFTFYEDFVERQDHNYAVTRPLQRHVLTRESFLRFLHQLFEVAKSKVYPSWKPSAVICCGLGWTEGCPEHLQSLRDVPYTPRIIVEENKEVQTNVDLTDNTMAISKGKMSRNKNSPDIEIKSADSLKYKKEPLPAQEQQENGFAPLSNIIFNKESISLFQVFEEEFDEYHVTFKGSHFHGSGVNVTFREDFADRQMHNLLLTIPLQSHILTQTNFQGFLHQLFEVAKNKIDASWKPSVVVRCGLNWTEGCPKHLQDINISQLHYSYSMNTIMEQSKEMHTSMGLTDYESAISSEKMPENNCLLDRPIKSVRESLTSEEHPPFASQQEQNGLTQLSKVQSSDKNFTLYQIFEEEFWQYYVAFIGYIFPVDGVDFTFYEDFLDRDLHNFVLEEPFQRHILTRESFLGFKHQLFEIAKSKCDPTWKPTAVLYCGPSWTEGCPKYLQSLREVPYSYNKKIIVEESNELQRHLDLCDNKSKNANEKSFESNSSLDIEIGEKHPSVAIEQQENGWAHLSRIPVYSDGEINQSLSKDCVVKHEFGYRLFFREFRSFYITFKASELQLNKGVVFQFYEDALECYTHNVVLSEECQLSVLCDVNFKKFLRAALNVSRSKTDSKWQPTAAKFKSSDVTWNEGEPAYLERLKFVPIGYDEWDSHIEEKNLSDYEEDDSDIGEEDQSEEELRLDEASEESESPASESETDEESSEEISEPLEEEIRACEKAEGAEGFNKREEEEENNETIAEGEAESKAEERIREALEQKDCETPRVEVPSGEMESLGEGKGADKKAEGVESLKLRETKSGKEVQIEKESEEQHETPEQITQGVERKPRESEVKDGEANRQSGEKKEKGMGHKQATEICNCELKERICTSLKLNDAEKECGKIAKSENVYEEGRGTKNKEHGLDAKRAQLQKKRENQTGIREHTLNNVANNHLVLCNATLNNVKRLEVVPTNALRPLEFNSGNAAPDPMDAEVNREGEKPGSKPSIKGRRRNRKRKNIITGWLCSKIIKAFVKSKTLL